MPPRGAAGRAGEFAARYVWLDPERVLEPGLVRWDARGRVTSLRRLRGAAAARVADVAVLPGLVDAHVHLQLGALPRVERSFLPWVGLVMASRRDMTPAAHRRAAELALRDLWCTGTTAIGEIDSTGQSPAALRRVPLGGRCYQELVGYHLDDVGARALIRQRNAAPRPQLRAARGLSPHAPYSVSASLVRAAARASRHLSVHCAELPEEQQFLHTGEGPFAELLARLGRLPEDHRARGCGAVRWLERLGVLRPATQLVHCQELERGDIARIVAAGASIVVCPGTIEWFRRAPPPVATWLRRGVPVALGTDSRASNTGLSMVAELGRAARFWPALSPAQLLAMATVHGARSLGVTGGKLRRGAPADFLVVPARASADATLTSFVQGELAPMETRLAGVSLSSVGER